MSSYYEVFSKAFEDKDLERNSTSNSASMEKKAKIVWTKALHEKFVEVVKTLGVGNAVPKKIVELMGVDGLTRNHVASHLQKYRLMLKNTSNNDSHNQVASISSSISNRAPLNIIPPLMVNEEQHNLLSHKTRHADCLPILDTSGLPIFEASNFNVTNSSETAHWGLLPYEGSPMQAMTNNFGEPRDFIYNATNLGVGNSVNSSAFTFVQNLDGFIYDHGGYSTGEQVYNNFEIYSSNGVQNSSNFFVSQNPNGIESNYSSQSRCIEMNQFHSIGSNNNMEADMIGEDDLIMNEADIASLLSYLEDDGENGGTSNNHHVTINLPNQDANEHNILKFDNLDSNRKEVTSTNEHHSLDENLPSFDPNFDMYNYEQFMEPMWSPNHLAEEMVLEGLTFNSHVQD